MRRQHRRPARPRGARALALLVFAVLAGVLAMHGPGSAPAADPAPDTSAAAHAATGHVSVAEPCEHTGPAHDGVDGHVAHADGTCAAAGTSSAPAPPALARSAAPYEPPAGHPAGHRTDKAGERAPPSLSELQLLRI